MGIPENSVYSEMYISRILRCCRPEGYISTQLQVHIGHVHSWRNGYIKMHKMDRKESRLSIKNGATYWLVDEVIIYLEMKQRDDIRGGKKNVIDLTLDTPL